MRLFSPPVSDGRWSLLLWCRMVAFLCRFPLLCTSVTCLDGCLLNSSHTRTHVVELAAAGNDEVLVFSTCVCVCYWLTFITLNKSWTSRFPRLIGDKPFGLVNWLDLIIVNSTASQQQGHGLDPQLQEAFYVDLLHVYVGFIWVFWVHHHHQITGWLGPQRVGDVM